MSDRFIGRYVIVRASAAGVHAGVLKRYDPATAEVELAEARRLWLWHAIRGVTLSEAAVYGLDIGDGRVKTGVAVPEHIILGVCEVIPCTKEAEDTIRALPMGTP